MKVSSYPNSDQTAALTQALQLIATGSGDEKIRYIALRDPDWFVSNLFSTNSVDSECSNSSEHAISRKLLDQTIAQLALSDLSLGCLEHSQKRVLPHAS